MCVYTIFITLFRMLLANDTEWDLTKGYNNGSQREDIMYTSNNRNNLPENLIQYLAFYLNTVNGIIMKN